MPVSLRCQVLVAMWLALGCTPNGVRALRIHREKLTGGAGILEPEPNLLCKLRAAVNISYLSYSDNNSDRLGKKWKSCAVVSNSGVMNMHRYGESIDRADLVMRFNGAPTGKWRKLVGTRDDIRMVCPGFLLHYLQKRTRPPGFGIHRQTTYVVVPFDIKGTLDPETGQHNLMSRFRKAYPGVQIYMLSPSMPRSLLAFLRSKYDTSWFHQGHKYEPTTGSLGMLLALSLCQEVRAYGMSASGREDLGKYHYWTSNGKASANSWHKTFRAEKDLWLSLSSSAAEEDSGGTDIVSIPGFASAAC